MSQTEINAGLEDIWYLKEILWSLKPEIPKTPIKIITQNFNGPCSFIAICNILILRGHLHIEPPSRTSVSYEYLSNLVAEYLLLSLTQSDPSAALSILPATRKGMDLNPLFTSVSSFRPAGDGGELKLFELTNIKLVHGWLVDPESPEYNVLSRVEDYDTSVNTIVFADHLTKGQLVQAPEDFDALVTDEGINWTSEERQKVEDAIVIRDFLARTSSQLTYHGLFHLASSGLEQGELVALFRGSHLSVLYKSPDPERPGLYTLVTDQIFTQEPSVVWECLEDVEGGASTFVDSDLVQSSPAGGDFPGRSAEAVRRDYEVDGIDTDQALAQQLQNEEDAHARALHAEEQGRAGEERRRHASAAGREADLAQNYGALGNLESGMTNLRIQPDRSDKKKKEKDCIIM